VTVPVLAASGPPVGPMPEDLARWTAADRSARPARLARLRERMAHEPVDAYFAVSRENIRYLTGFALADGEEKVAGNSGRSLISADEVVVLADSRYTIQAREEAPEARIEPCDYDLAERWVALIESFRRSPRSRGVPRVAVEAAILPHAVWTAIEDAAPEVELVAAEGWVGDLRQVKEPAEIERIAAACRLGDAALEQLLPRIAPGATERELAWELEAWLRTHGAEALAFDVAVLGGERAALPHGSPGDRPVRAGEVLLFDFGAQVAGYRSDMTRTLFVGDPTERDLAVYEVVAAAQGAAIASLEAALGAARHGAPLPSGRSVDAVSRGVIEADGRWPAFGHGLGHGIGLATHELPSLGRQAPETPLPSPTVFSIEPGIYLEGETGVRIEDLVALDAQAGRLEPLTRFPAGVVVVGT